MSAMFMSALLFLAALFVGFISLSRFMLGQLYFGHFSIAATLAGIAGMFCAAFALKMSSQRSWAPANVYSACFIALIGVALEAGIHYVHFDIQGNYYAWHVVGPYAACIVLFAYVAGRRRSSSRADA